MDKTILIIEDEKDLAEIIKARLETLAYQVELAYDGEQGLARAKELKPALIILDLKLPILDGFKVCEQLKSDEAFKTIPIIILTARDTDFEKQIGRSLGADAYLTKPYEPEELIAKVLELTGKPA